MSGLGTKVELLAVQLPGDDRPGTPYLEQLWAAVYSGVSKNASGAAEQWRIPLNAAASQLWDRVSGEIAAEFHGATLLRPNKSPQVNLLAWWAVFSAAIERHEVGDLQIDVASMKLATWIADVRRLLDPPRVKEIVEACPRCAAVKVDHGEGELRVRSTALAIEFKPGMSMYAICRSCQGVWGPGNAEIIRLGKEIGRELDPDKIRDALTPTLVDTWSSDEIREEKLDLSNPMHVALVEARRTEQAKRKPRTS